MKKMKRVVVIVLDGVGAGWQKDAAKYGDEGADTLGHVIAEMHPDIPNLTELGLLKTIDRFMNISLKKFTGCLPSHL